jgi:hypothetical protein
VLVPTLTSAPGMVRRTGDDFSIDVWRIFANLIALLSGALLKCFGGE